MASLNNNEKNAHRHTAAKTDNQNDTQDNVQLEKLPDFGEILESFRPDEFSDDFFYEITYSLDDKTFLKAVYHIYLKRTLDAPGRYAWIPVIHGSKPFRKKCLKKIRQSGEFQQKWPSAKQETKGPSVLEKIKSALLDFAVKVFLRLFKPIF